ncbi:MAG: YjjG family noncanonical pyrimidine nucleotidase [Candidatus Faecousia sp.]|nr:YjjG family noncanonical pyrimidine nucleotidase [Candidatus Faecousia sp.]
MMEYLFLDLDDTILDFHKAERIALSKTLADFSLEPTEAVLARYHVINRLHWERLERGELTRDQVLEGRFQVLFAELGHPVDAEAVTRCYERNLGIGHYFLPGAQEAVARLHRKYRLFLASNGTASVQHARLTSAGLYPYFEKVFISQDIGHNKPSKEYFDTCFSQIPGFAPDKAMMVGDSLTSDILGGIRAGIKTCWVNPDHLPPRQEIPADFEIEKLSQLEALLEAM